MMNSKLNINDKNIDDIIRPKNIFKEVKTIISYIFQNYNYDIIVNIFKDIKDLYEGNFKGYQKCDTRYHDLCHTEDCLLIMARLIHGAYLNGYFFSEENVNLGLISALLHDTGYIKEDNDDIGTGGKFTLVHIDRSIDFLKEYLPQRDFTAKEIQFCVNCLNCTGLTVKINTIEFISPENELMGKILGTSDLIGQMGDPSYLQKLPYLFLEFQEAGVKMYKDEFDLLEKTPGFWEFTKDRFENELGKVDRYLRDHFRIRWRIDRDLDRESIERNINHLKYILTNHRKNYRRLLKFKNV